jgi:hypothetical protein
MKNLLPFILFALIFSSCDKDEDINQLLIPDPQNNVSLPELNNPDIILNDLATGEIDSRILNVRLEGDYQVPWNLDFEYLEGSSKIHKMISTNPNYYCETTTIDYSYRSDGYINKIALETINTCLEFVVNKVFHYNYENGILKSITMDNESFIENTYFSYNPDGTVEKKYIDLRPKSDPVFPGYYVTKYEYDSNKNVVSLIQESPFTNGYDQKFTFTYDNFTNPFKGFFLSQSMRKPSLGVIASAGPFFLSQNNITSTKSEYINVSANPTFEFYFTNIESDRISDYGNTFNEYWFKYYLSY